MKSCVDGLVLRSLSVVLLAAVLASAARGQEEELPIEGAVMPLEVYDDGTVKTRVSAARARIPASGDIVAVDAKIEFFHPDGELESRIISERLRYDRQQGVATSDAGVRYERRGVVITGEGFEWRGGEQYVRILNNAKVVFCRREIKGLGSRLGRSAKEEG